MLSRFFRVMMMRRVWEQCQIKSPTVEVRRRVVSQTSIDLSQTPPSSSFVILGWRQRSSKLTVQRLDQARSPSCEKRLWASCLSVCLSIRPRGTRRLAQDGFSWNLIRAFLENIAKIQVLLQYVKNNGYFVHGDLYIFMISCSVLRKMSNVADKNSRENQSPLFFNINFADRASQYIYLNINQLDAVNFIMSLFHASTCFEHMCSSSLNLCTGLQPIGVMLPQAV